jgi:SAM-dependent methyltransferase
MIRRAFAILKKRGLRVLVRAATFRIRGAMARRAKLFQLHQHLFIGKSGIEIGGPSAVFANRGIFPVYPLVACLDNVNFSSTTTWPAGGSSSAIYRYNNGTQHGTQYIAEATSMGKLASDSYDFVISSHMLEHTANPVLVLIECERILKEYGTIAFVLPNKKFTFDHRRPVTTIAHLIADFEAGTEENDLTHLPEILLLHDLMRDPDAGDNVEFKNRCLRNFENRCMHHHVFDVSLAVELLNYIGLSVCATEETQPHHILILARKMTPRIPSEALSN